MSTATKFSVLVAAFVMTLGLASGSASAETYTNSNPITIPDHGMANPYPSTIGVGSEPGQVITDVSVTLHGFSHSAPSDVDIRLVSPNGDPAVVMSDACGLGFENYTFTFTRTASASMPGDPGTLCGGFYYRPTDYDPGENWPGTVPGPSDPDFGSIIGHGFPNGDWKLYVFDDTPGNSGKIERGWSLTVTTATPDAVVPAVPATGAQGAADPYPITRSVTGLSGVIKDVNVSLNGFYHDNLADLDLLLVGPHGEAVKLMSDACGITKARGASWTWDDEAARPMPALGCDTGSYQPTDYDGPAYEPPDQFPNPAPQGPYSGSLSAFDATDPNGQWRLFAYDDYYGQANGFFLDRYQLDITTRPKSKVAFTERAVEVTEGQPRELTLTRPAGSDPLGAGAVTVTSSPGSATSGTDFTPISTTVSFAPGQTQAQVPVEALADASAEGPETFTVSLSSATGDADAPPAGTVVTIHDPASAPSGNPGPAPGSAPALTANAVAAGQVAGGGPALDHDPPVISNVRVARTAIAYTLSEPARVSLKVQRTRGKRSLAAGALQVTGQAGPNRVPFTGRIGRRTLRPGRYRLTVTAVDPAGNRAVSRPRSFRITHTPKTQEVTK